MDEALRSNDEYQIYMKILDMFTESNKLKVLFLISSTFYLLIFKMYL